MNFELSEDQVGILDGLEQLLKSTASPASGAPVTAEYAPGLDTALREAGFLSIASEEGFGPLEAALIVERVARLPQVVEVAASALVSPLLPQGVGGPLALLEGSAKGALRFLPVATNLLILDGRNARLVKITTDMVEPVDSLLAYPYGRLREPSLAIGEVISGAAELRRRWRIGLAVEAAGVAKAALDLMIDHVKTRRAFGRPLGAFQAIQHRLAMAAETAESAKWLALRAAYSDREADAAIAAGFVQSRIAALTYDLHQFSGAMGLTLEFPLHLWTYRLRALAGELGGASRQARAAAELTWGSVQ
jgi:alkylation response protein AidB-like acyl-CoA dehydrogenase